MPQATEAQRAKWGGRMGVGEDKAIAYLEGKGFRLTPQFSWVKPSAKYEPSIDEWEAIEFLVDEWDYAALEEDED